MRHVVLRGLSVVRTALAKVDWSAPRSAFGAPGAALSMHNAESCRIEGCRIRQGSGSAISGSGTVRRCAVSNCHISEMGGGGISLAGGLCDPEPPVAGNRLTGNHIHHCGSLYWHSSGIAAGIAHRTAVAGNHIHDMPYVGISTGGYRHRWFAGWPRVMDELIDFWKRRGAGAPTILAVKEHLPGYNRIEDNRIERVMLQLDDGAAIYCHAGHHNAVRRNVVVGTPRDGSHGLYFDDEECFSLMEHNVVVACPDRRHTRRGSALHLHNNAGNTVRQNIFVGADVLFTCPNSYGGHRIEENVFLFSDRCRLRSHPAPVMGPGDGRRQDGWVLGPSVMDGNLYWSARGSGPAEGLVRRLRELGFEAGAVVADPRLEVGDDGQWSLGVGSPVRDLIGELERLPDVG